MNTLNNQLMESYAFVLVKKDETFILDIEKEDLIMNADDELDVPFDQVLRKHNLTLHDLYHLQIDELRFIRSKNDTSSVLRVIPLNINF